MSTDSTNDVDEQYKAQHQAFEILQAKVVDLRNAVLIQRAAAVIAFRRYKKTKTLLAEYGVELKRLHQQLHPNDE